MLEQKFHFHSTPKISLNEIIHQDFFNAHFHQIVFTERFTNNKNTQHDFQLEQQLFKQIYIKKDNAFIKTKIFI